MNASEPPVWSIRKATTQDRESVDDLQSRVKRPPRSDSVINEYFVAMTERGIVGCAAVRKQEKRGYLYGLAVDKSWRKKGIGHALTQTRLDWLRDQDVASAFVMSMFWNIRFFRKHGFTLTNKGVTAELKQLHNDFSDSWSSRSALLVVHLSSSSAISDTRGKNEQGNARA
jgi:N-acetylglutamate synthase-like GNAT family acetyltransferase